MKQESARYTNIKKEQYIEKCPPLQRLRNIRFPFNHIVRIQVNTQQTINKKTQLVKKFGTGCLLSQNIVLSCLHTLEHPDKGETVRQNEIKVYCEHEGTNGKKKSIKVYGMKYNPRYFDQKGDTVKYDYALLLLDPEVKMDYDEEGLKLHKPSLERKRQIFFQLYGYDMNYNQAYREERKLTLQYHLWGIKSDLLEMSEHFIEYQVSTDNGKSGAPLIAYHKQGRFKIIGIHIGKTFGHKPCNFALRVNDSMIKQICEWAEDWNKDKGILATYGQEHHHREIENEDLFKQRIGEIVCKLVKDLYRDDDNQEYPNPPRHINPPRSHPQPLFRTHHSPPKQPPQKNLSQFIEPQKQNEPITRQKNQNEAKQEPPNYNINSLERLSQYCQTVEFGSISTLKVADRVFDFSLVVRLKNLVNLSLIACQLKEVPKLDTLTNLQAIDCSRNLISDASNFFIDSVMTLTLDYNCIKDITGAVGNANNLKDLSLNYNSELEMFDEVIFSLPNLQFLKIRGIKRTSLNNDLFNKLCQKIYSVQTD